MQRIENGEDLHGAERVQYVRVVVHVAAEPACAQRWRLGHEHTNTAEERTVGVLAGENPFDDVVFVHLVGAAHQIQGHQRPVGPAHAQVLCYIVLKRVRFLHAGQNSTKHKHKPSPKQLRRFRAVCAGTSFQNPIFLDLTDQRLLSSTRLSVLLLHNEPENATNLLPIFVSA